MKSIMKLSLNFVICFFFSLVQIYAQKTSLPSLLIGEWTMSGQSKPQINDTIILTKKLLNEIDHPRWKFSMPNKLEERYTIKKVISGQALTEAINSFFNWHYDNSTSLLEILNEKSDLYFKINPDNDQIIKLICVK